MSQFDGTSGGAVAAGRSTWIVARVAAIIAGAALLAVIPTGTLARLPSICLFKNVFGFSCPGCGMGRAFSALLHGDVAAALDYNVLIIVAAPVAAGFVLRDLFILRRKRKHAIAFRGHHT